MTKRIINYKAKFNNGDHTEYRLEAHCIPTISRKSEDELIIEETVNLKYNTSPSKFYHWHGKDCLIQIETFTQSPREHEPRLATTWPREYTRHLKLEIMPETAKVPQELSDLLDDLGLEKITDFIFPRKVKIMHMEIKSTSSEN